MSDRIYIVLLIIASCLSCSNTIKLSNKGNAIENTNQKNGNIPWSENYKLTWDDFKGTVDSSQEYAAITWTLVERNQTGLLEDKIFLTVNNFFLRNQSWVKRGSENEELLSHERLHWDIVEFLTRKLRKIYSEHLSLNINDSYIFFNKEYNNMLEEQDRIQELYDLETDFSKNSKKQKEWADKINKMLKEYEDYSNVNVIIKRTKE
jgi:hypothetical protein